MINCSVTAAAIDGRLWSSTMSMFTGWPTPLTVMPPLPLIQFWQKRYPSLAICPAVAWLPVNETTAPRLIGSPVGRGVAVWVGVHAARSSELTAISRSTKSRELGTTVDYGLETAA